MLFLRNVFIEKEVKNILTTHCKKFILVAFRRDTFDTATVYYVKKWKGMRRKFAEEIIRVLVALFEILAFPREDLPVAKINYLDKEIMFSPLAGFLILYYRFEKSFVAGELPVTFANKVYLYTPFSFALDFTGDIRIMLVSAEDIRQDSIDEIHRIFTIFRNVAEAKFLLGSETQKISGIEDFMSVLVP